MIKPDIYFKGPDYKFITDRHPSVNQHAEYLLQHVKQKNNNRKNLRKLSKKCLGYFSGGSPRNGQKMIENMFENCPPAGPDHFCTTF